MNTILSVERDRPIDGAYHQCQGNIVITPSWHTRCGGDASWLITFEGELTGQRQTIHLCTNCTRSIIGPDPQPMPDNLAGPLAFPEGIKHISIQEWMKYVAANRAGNYDGYRFIMTNKKDLGLMWVLQWVYVEGLDIWNQSPEK